MLNYDSGDIINVGAAEDLTIAELAALVSEVVAYGGQIVFGASKPDGPPRKLIDVSFEILGLVRPNRSTRRPAANLSMVSREWSCFLTVAWRTP